MKTEPVGGHPTHLRRFGTGARPALALHCSLAHGGAWGPMAAELGDVLTLTAPDLPGHGHSADWPANGSLHDTATDVAAALARRIGDGAPVDILGHSFGGTVALRLALEHPELVRSLTLFEPVMFSAAAADNAPEAADWIGKQARFHNLLDQGRRNEAAAVFHALWGNGTPLDHLPDSQRRYIIDRIEVIRAAEDVVERDRTGLVAPGRLEALRLPVLLAAGSRSPGVIHAIIRALATRIPGARHIVMEGAGHMLPLSHAALLAPAVRDHLGLQARR
ncbi:Pimeloyl-ACP methyl ester carboxylesterase [Gemmobacter megaterium]|uniref:Pimeloyl-ACP methyl ester carboxylesterase n=1 Tax=Gemmobacter megaterium TaxID=1086013 RepID=A0A1N7MLX6_9RHOB|nr:alpha/beta hydrolase [Gemmobacter megaterium]GGE06133.1 hypothetical protein GCM10011345_09550 [Gemmobacter megaterium]SIS86939.1 Pimeloyl-ACP methyl ester carboxylesterase [Gemmobacter megaterium]